MVGACGVIGDGVGPTDGMAETLAWTGEERSVDFRDEHLSLRGFTHRSEDGEATTGNAHLWVWGNVLGVDGEDGYRPRDPTGDGSAAAFCARLYEEHGPAFVSGLNGDFVGIVYDRERSTVSMFTDRLGSWRLFYTVIDDGPLVFSSHVQSLARHPQVSPEFDGEYVVHHLTGSGGPYGVKTPLRGVETFPPGTVTTYDIDTGGLEREVYWRPRFDPRDEPYDHFVGAFVDRFRESMRDRTRDTSKRYGVLLSGGSDSRLVLSALDDDLDVVAYHMADWMSKEARIAERTAMAKGVEFRFLRREPDYFEGLLERTPAMWNFEQLFVHGWAEGFMDEVRSEVDVLLTGHYADTMFGGMFVPRRHVSLGPFGPFELPLGRQFSSLDGFIRDICPASLSYVDAPTDPHTVLESNMRAVDGRVESFGVEFDSLSDCSLALAHYPSTTDSFFRQSLREHLVLQMPLLDNRLMDLWLSMPTRFALRQDVVGSAVRATDPELAAIPHASSGVPVGAHRVLHSLGTVPMNALRRLSPFDALPTEEVSHNPWGRHAELIRHRPYVEESLYGSEDLIRSLPFLDWEEVVACYEDHLEGANNTLALYRLVTLLEAPVTRSIAEAGSSAANAPGGPDPGGTDR